MARRKNDNEEPEVAETAGAPEGTEPEQTEQAPKTEAPAEPKPEIDLSEFEAAANAAVAEADQSTGSIPEAALSAITTAYRALDGVAAKNKAKSWTEDQMKQAVQNDNIVLARSFIGVKDALSAGSSAAPKAPADPTVAFVNKVTSLNLAIRLVSSLIPEGVSDDWPQKVDQLTNELNDQVEAFKAWRDNESEDKGEAPEVSPVVKAAFRYSAGRASGGPRAVFTGTRKSIQKHIDEVFANLNSGDFLTINEIAKAHSDEYGDTPPSAGAVSARLFPKGKDPYNENGVKAVAEEGKSRGAVKVA